MRQARFTLLALAPAVALFGWSIARRFVTEAWASGPIGFFAALGVALALVAVRWGHASRRAGQKHRARVAELSAALDSGVMDVLDVAPRRVAIVDSAEGEGLVLDLGGDELLLLWMDGVETGEGFAEVRQRLQVAWVGDAPPLLWTEGEPVLVGDRLAVEALGEALAAPATSVTRFRGRWSSLEADLGAPDDVRPV